MQRTLPCKADRVKGAVENFDGPNATSTGNAASDLGAALSRPGLYLDGHTVDPLPVIEQVLRDSGRRTLTLVDSHKAAGAAEALYRQRLDARAYPKRTPRDASNPSGNCRSFAEIEQAEAAGLAPGMAVCPVCEHRKDCRFYRQQERAELAQHAIAVTARAGADFLGMTESRDAIFVVSDHAASFFRPPSVARGSAADVRATLATVATAARHVWYGTLDERPFWRRLAELADGISQRIDGAPADKPGHGFIQATPQEADPPPAWAASFWAALKSLQPAPRRDVVRLVTGAAVGRLGELSGVRDGETVELAGFGKTPVPDKPVVVFGYEAAADLSRCTDRIILSLGDPEPLAVPVWQAAVHMTAQGRPKRAADLIRSFVALWGVRAVGVLMHRKATSGVIDELGPLAKLPSAPKFAVGHWRGDVRHLRGCDLIVALGTPTVPPESVRVRLLQTGQTEAAAAPGDWGPLPWEATTAAGETVLMPRQGYGNPAWQAVHHALLETAVRRTLALIGRPAVLLADEQLDFPVIQPPRRLSRKDAKILTALSIVAAVRRGDTSSSASQKLLEDNAPWFSSLLAVFGKRTEKCHPITAAVLAGLVGLKPKSVHNRLTVLRAAGFVAYRNRFEGWTLPAAAWSPVAAPGLPSPSASAPPRDSKPAFAAAAAVLVCALVGLVAAQGGRWEGPATALEVLLAGYARSNRVKALRAWLGSADRIGRAVRRLEKQLAAAGVAVAVRRARGGVRMIVLKTTKGEGE